MKQFKDLKVRIQRSFMISRIVLLDLMQRTSILASKDAKEVAIEIFHYLKVIICQDLE